MTQNFALIDVLALIGLAQSVYLVVYIAFRAGNIRNAIVPMLCFVVLTLAFTADLAASRWDGWEWNKFIPNMLWLFIPSLSVLLIKQVAEFGKFPPLIYWVSLSFPILSGVVGFGIYSRIDIMMTLGVIFGCVSFLILWISRHSFEDLKEDKTTKNERYWLIISFIIINVLMIFLNLLDVSGVVSNEQFILIRDILGIGLVYLASTSLLRIYPQAVKLVSRPAAAHPELSSEDREIIGKINDLLELDKVYQEQKFSRADLARELNISEANLSRIISSHFGKSLPQLINELRVHDSLQLLSQTEENMTVIAEQVGFNSLPTFNRVFKDIMNVAPSEYRKTSKKS